MQDYDAIYSAIQSVIAGRGQDKSTCPSEIARMLFPEDWCTHMKDIVKVVIELQTEGKALITQKGVPVDVTNIKGPIRIKLPDC